MNHIIAIIRSDQLEKVESRLQAAGAPGLTVSTVKGYGEYAGFLAHDWMVKHVRLELFAEAEESTRLVGVIAEAARTGAEGDGIIAVDRLVHVRSRRERSAAPQGSDRIVVPIAEESRTVSTLWSMVTVLGLLGIAVSVVISAKHQLHALTVSLLAILVFSAAVGLFSLSRGRKSTSRKS
jgi:nitrogen regulatory protein P-II 1